jgi:hypothetical protein
MYSADAEYALLRTLPVVPHMQKVASDVLTAGEEARHGRLKSVMSRVQQSMCHKIGGAAIYETDTIYECKLLRS